MHGWMNVVFLMYLLTACSITVMNTTCNENVGMCRLIRQGREIRMDNIDKMNNTEKQRDEIDNQKTKSDNID